MPSSMPSGSVFWISASSPRTACGDRDRVGAALLADAEPCAGSPSTRDSAADVLEAVLDERDVLEVDRRARRVRDHDAAQASPGRAPRRARAR